VASSGHGFRLDLPLLVNALLGCLQLGLAIASLAALLPALDLQVPFPLLGMVAYLMMSNVMSAVLPEGFGASSAASGLAVLTLLGMTEAQAVAFALLAWFVRIGPIVALGAYPLVSHAGSVGDAIQDAP
jgi:O-antigen ligase